MVKLGNSSRNIHFVRLQVAYNSFSLDSQIEKDLVDSVLYFAVDVSNRVLNDIEICFAFVFLVKLADIFPEIKSKVSNVISGFKQKWLRGDKK